jgi:ADP-ribose pyrophosphatase YjhB (NUDIX family)
MNTKLKVGVVIENEDSSKILLIKEKLQKKENFLWNLIKGSYEKDDSSVIKTAERECLEEIGVKINLKHILAVYFSRKAEKN